MTRKRLPPNISKMPAVVQNDSRVSILSSTRTRTLYVRIKPSRGSKHRKSSPPRRRKAGLKTTYLIKWARPLLCRTPGSKIPIISSQVPQRKITIRLPRSTQAKVVYRAPRTSKISTTLAQGNSIMSWEARTNKISLIRKISRSSQKVWLKTGYQASQPWIFQLTKPSSWM